MDCVGRTLLSAAFDLALSLRVRLRIRSLKLRGKSKVKSRVKSGGEECPPTRFLCQVEKQHFGVCGVFNCQELLFAYGCAIALLQALAV
jgi:hypothetical protein